MVLIKSVSQYFLTSGFLFFDFWARVFSLIYKPGLILEGVCTFKGTLTRNFWPLFFSIKQLPLGPWDTGLSLFLYGLVFAEQIDFVNDVHSGVIDSAETCTANSLTPLCSIANFEKISAESLTPLWPAQRSHWLRCANMTPLWLLT